MGNVLKIHESDPNFPSPVIDKIKEFLSTWSLGWMIGEYLVC